MRSICFLKSALLVLLCALVAQGVLASKESEVLKQLRADYASLMDAMAEYEAVAASGSISAGEKDDYAFWIMQLREKFTETCHILSNHPDVEISADIPCGEYASSYTEAADIDIEREYTEGEKTASIEGRFNDSLGEFDEKLLREQDRVKAMRPQNTSGGAGSGGGASGGQGEGEGEGESSAGSESGDGEQGDQRSEGQPGRNTSQRDAGSNRDSDQQGQGTRGDPQRGNQDNIPDDIPDGSDDDVVARQLREAAEKETDPELREKLWDEYRRYKKGQ